MRKIAFLCSLVLLCGQLLAQSRIISGKVQDEKGNPVPGASVQIKGSRRGTSTTQDGVFSISVPASAKAVVVSSVNFSSQEIPISENMTIVLKPAVNANLQEVVVVAYGTQKKSEVTAAVSTVNADAIKNQQVVSVGQALQGTAPGVMVVNTNGQPGENPTIRIRGIASISASADPLIVLDGVPYDGNLNMINPSDIENFSVLKDASATALYGSRAANGVILINTKSGRKNATPNITLSATYGISSRAIKDYAYLNTQQQFELGWEALKNVYSDNPGTAANAANLATANLIKNGFHYNPYGPNFPNPVGTDGKLLAGAKPLWNDDWTKALTRSTAARRDVNLGIGGGTDRSKYYFSVGYLNQDGYVVKSNYQRVTTTLNYTTDLTNWLTIGARTNIVSSKQNYPAQGDGTYSDVIQYGRTMSSVFPIYARNDSGVIIKDASGNPIFDYGKPSSGRTVNVNRPVLQLSNVVGTVNLDNWDYDRLLTNLNAYGQVNFTKNLYYKTTFGINRYTLDQLHYENKDFGDAAAVGGRTYREEDLTTSWTWNNMIGYDQRFGDHHIEAMASYESYKYNYETIYGSKTGFAFPSQQQLSNASTNEDFEGYTVSTTLVSYLARVKYDYQDKYFAEFTIRRDGSAIFAPGHRYGTFPAGGVSWLISKEDFMHDLNNVNMLKLRASYGAVGNNALLDASNNRLYFPYLNPFATGNNDLTNPGVYLNQLGNAQIQWEKQLSANIGIDFELFKSRFTGSIDLFQKNSQHLILSAPLAPSAGFGAILSNVGKVQNAGIELSLNYGILRSKDFNWDVSLNITYLTNKIKSLLPGTDTFAASGAFRDVVGKSIYEFYLPVWAGVDPATGHGQWWIDSLDNVGHPTGKSRKTNSYSTAQTSEKWSGSGIPKYTGGFSTKFAWRKLDLNILFNFAFGGKYLDNNYINLMNGTYSGFGAQLNVDELRRWNTPGQITDVPRLNPNNNDEEQRSTRYLYSGDYIRLRNITLGYTFNPEITKKVVKAVRLYVQADNIYTWDKLKRGSDPESALNGDANGNAFPFKTLSAGLDFNF
jgi:TonB-linked SusC/RagA family outer membrane protein